MWPMDLFLRMVISQFSGTLKITFFFINRSAFGKRHWMETGCVSVMWTKVRDKSQTVKGHCHSYQPQNYIQFSMFLLCFAIWRIRKTLWIMGNEESKSSTSSSLVKAETMVSVSVITLNLQSECEWSLLVKFIQK